MSGSAGVARKLLFDFRDSHPLAELGNRLKIAVAAAGEANVTHHVAIEAKVDARGANVLSCIGMFRNISPFPFFSFRCLVELDIFIIARFSIKSSPVYKLWFKIGITFHILSLAYLFAVVDR